MMPIFMSSSYACIAEADESLRRSGLTRAQ
jgi:hypothetical protein